MDKIEKYLNEGKLPFNKKDIEKGLKFLQYLTSREDILKITDWDPLHIEIWEEDTNKKTWYTLKQAVNKLFFWIQ